MKRWETFDGEDEDVPAYGIWSRRDVDLEAQWVKRYTRSTEEARQNMSKAQKKRRRRAR